METNPYTPLASFIDLLIDAVFAVDIDANVVFASVSCESIFGYTPKEMVGKNMFDMMVPEDRDRTRASVGDIMSGQHQINFENRYVRKDGQIVHIMWSTRWSPADQLRIGVARDITEHKQAESLQAALYSITEAVYEADDLFMLFERIQQIVGTLMPVDNFSIALYDKETGQLSFPYHIDKYHNTLEPVKLISGMPCVEIINTGQPLLLTPETILTKLGKQPVFIGTKPLCWLGVPLKSQKDTIGVLMLKSYPGGVCYSQKDQELLQFVSTQIATAIERQKIQDRLKYMAQYDQLTGLPNRGFLYDRLKVALSVARRDQRQFSVLYIDLDKFKQVNDTFGHSVGDLLLQKAAQRMKLCVRESDTISRIGGDEFVVLLQGAELPEQAEWVAKKISKTLTETFILDGHSLNIVPSIGIAQYPNDGDTEQQLLKQADKAMYLAKSKKNN